MRSAREASMASCPSFFPGQNAHESCPAGAHTASAISATPHNLSRATSVQSQLQEITSDLGSQADAQGASLIGSAPIAETRARSPRSTCATNWLQSSTISTPHATSGDHDRRYLGRIYRGSQTISASTAQFLANLSVVPDFVTVSYNQVDASGQPTQPQYFQEPLRLHDSGVGRQAVQRSARALCEKRLGHSALHHRERLLDVRTP